MKRIILSLLMTATVMLGTQAQHITIHKTNGDSIQWNIHDYFQIKPGADGKPVWVFDNTTQLMPAKTIGDIASVKMHTQAETERQVRQALIEFYYAMDGPNWICQDNWLSDRPLDEWYGIHTVNGWVSTMRLNVNNLSGSLPDCIMRLGPVSAIELGGNQISGIPEWLPNIYSLSEVSFGNMGLTTLPESLWDLPLLKKALLRYNKFSGPIPEGVTKLMSNSHIDGTFINLGYNQFTSIPDAVKNHPRFGDFWPGLLSSNLFTNPVKDANDNFTIDIPAPVFSTKDFDGNIFNTGDIYQKNKYTLLIKWCAYQDPILMNNICLAYNHLKNDTDGEGLGVAAMYYHDEQSVDEIKAFLADKGISGDQWKNSKWDDWTESYYNFLGYGILAYHLVDHQGKIVWSTLIDAQGRGIDDDNYDRTYEDMLIPKLEQLFGQEIRMYASTDYSKDGEVTQLQSASVGQGVDIVFVGDGFVDTDMTEGGVFDQKMHDAMEQFFAYEPFTSLRNRFNVYAVKAVSKNAEFGIPGAEHAIDENPSRAFEYAQNITTLKAGAPMRVNVVYKTNSGGRSYCTMYEDKSYVSFTMNGVCPTLNHEGGGHGIGLLYDEYVEPGRETVTLPETSKTYLDNMWALGCGANVDYHSSPMEVKWAHFIDDLRYAAENIGVFEGSYLFGYGAYRPTETSMMRDTGNPFNAPSREAIYKYVMQESEGAGWTYDYETFVAFDEAGRTEFVNALNSNARQRAPKKGVQKAQQLTAPPVLVKGTWRDALMKK